MTTDAQMEALQKSRDAVTLVTRTQGAVHGTVVGRADADDTWKIKTQEGPIEVLLDDIFTVIR